MTRTTYGLQKLLITFGVFLVRTLFITFVGQIVTNIIYNLFVLRHSPYPTHPLTHLSQAKVRRNTNRLFNHYLFLDILADVLWRAVCHPLPLVALPSMAFLYHNLIGSYQLFHQLFQHSANWNVLLLTVELKSSINVSVKCKACFGPSGLSFSSFYDSVWV